MWNVRGDGAVLRRGSVRGVGEVAAAVVRGVEGGARWKGLGMVGVMESKMMMMRGLGSCFV